jgi:hypothetical protein
MQCLSTSGKSGGNGELNDAKNDANAVARGVRVATSLISMKFSKDVAARIKFRAILALPRLETHT